MIMVADTWSAQMDSAKWKWFKTCNCGGVLKHKYRNVTNAQLELQIMPNRGKFNLFSGNLMLAGDLLTKLKQTIETL